MLVGESSSTKLPLDLLQILNALKQEKDGTCVFEKHDLVVGAVCILLKECGMLPSMKVLPAKISDGIHVAPFYSLPKVWRNEETGHYNLSFVLNDFMNNYIRFIGIPLDNLLIVNLIVDTITTQCYSVSVDCDKYVNSCEFCWDAVASCFKNLKDLSLQLKNSVGHPARSLILNEKGITNGSFLGIPSEMQLKILGYLSIQDLGRMSQSCSYFYQLCKEDSLWGGLTKGVIRTNKLKYDKLWNRNLNFKNKYLRGISGLH